MVTPRLQWVITVRTGYECAAPALFLALVCPDGVVGQLTCPYGRLGAAWGRATDRLAPPPASVPVPCRGAGVGARDALCAARASGPCAKSASDIRSTSAGGSPAARREEIDDASPPAPPSWRRTRPPATRRRVWRSSTWRPSGGILRRTRRAHVRHVQDGYAGSARRAVLCLI